MRHAAALATCVWAALAAGGAEAHEIRTLYSFCQPNCQANEDPAWGVVEDAAGNMFGVASQDGGSYQFNIVYELEKPHHGARRLKVLHVFCTAIPNCREGGNIQSGLIQDVAGNLYGVTASYGPKGYGTVFELVHSPSGRTWYYHLLHAFPDNRHDGKTPAGKLSYAGASTGAPYDGISPLYGTTETGGAFDVGVAYQIQPSSGRRWTLNIIHDFGSDSDGAVPIAGVLVDTAGNLFGTTNGGGTGNSGPNRGGTIFELTKASGGWNEQVLYNFCSQPDCADSGFPFAALAMDSAGVLYGATTAYGPSNGHRFGEGAVFKLTPDSGVWNFQILHGFCIKDGKCLDGEAPSQAVTLDGSGNLYGVTSFGGRYGKGVLFRIDTAGQYRVLHAFCSEANCADGAVPLGQLLLDPRGFLIGTTDQGGAFGFEYAGGTIFQFRP